MPKKTAPTSLLALEKCPTGIQGLDEITSGGFPRGRPTLVCGSAGCGKTVLAMEFLIRGATQFGEPGLFMAFEEKAEDLAKNFASLGFDLPALEQKQQIAVDYVRIERAEIAETGEYDLEGLFVRLGYAIDRIGAQRVVLDTIESLFSGFANENLLRAELRRLFSWLKEKGVTAVITGESGEKTLTRQGLEEYVSDCVIVLDHRVTAQLSTRRVRIVKYRGSTHGTNEYPFLITSTGLSVFPITSAGLQYGASDKRISSGVPGLDEMLSGKGFFRGASVLISGTAGTGKSSLSAYFAKAACDRGERCLYFAFEESPDQIVRNMRSIGLDLQPSVDKGLLQFHAVRSTALGLEAHLVMTYDLLDRLRPSVAIFDPINTFLSLGSSDEVRSMLTRTLDLLKLRGTTSIFTSLAHNTQGETADVAISSLMDTWILVRILEHEGERTRGLYVLKSRGMGHSNQVREFVLSDTGIDLVDVYVGPGMVLTGSARTAQESRDAADALARQDDIASRRRELEAKRTMLEAQIVALRAEFDMQEQEVVRLLNQAEATETAATQSRAALVRARTKIQDDQPKKPARRSR